MIYIYSNGEYHADSEYAEDILHLGSPLMVMSDEEFGRVFRGRIRIKGNSVSFPNNDGEEKIKEKLELELSQVNNRLSRLDYIGIKIATGRGTREEYAKEIAEMQELADRKNEINASLALLD